MAILRFKSMNNAMTETHKAKLAAHSVFGNANQNVPSANMAYAMNAKPMGGLSI